MSALDLLLKREWSMGNGQCPECHGMGAIFASWNDPNTLGHNPDCRLADAIKELGGNAVMVGQLKDDGNDPFAAQRSAMKKMHEEFHDAIMADIYAATTKEQGRHG